MSTKRIFTVRFLCLSVILTLLSLSPLFVAAQGINLLTNGDMEGGTTGWSVFGAGVLASNTST